MARRIAEEMGQSIGQAVGYKIRFQDATSPDAYVKVMTDGILLAEAAGDRSLSAYDTLIVDEAHERSLNIDFILGYLRTLTRRRRDMRVIITSATIDTAKFSKAFADAPVIVVTGRTYPVEVRYEPPAENGDAGESTPAEQAAAAVGRILRVRRPGDILVFMPTEQDIRETVTPDLPRPRPVPPFPHIRQIVTGLPILAGPTLAMCLPMPFGWPVVVPSLAVSAPNEPPDHASVFRLVGPTDRSFNVDDRHFVDGDFHDLLQLDPGTGDGYPAGC